MPCTNWKVNSNFRTQRKIDKIFISLCSKNLVIKVWASAEGAGGTVAPLDFHT